MTTETRVTSRTGGQKGAKEEQFHTMPPEALFELARVYKFGAGKYSDYNYRRGYEWSLSFNALMRHAFAFWSGETNDPESGLNHMAHVAWHALNLVLFSNEGEVPEGVVPTTYQSLDDRPTGVAADYGEFNAIGLVDEDMELKFEQALANYVDDDEIDTCPEDCDCNNGGPALAEMARAQEAEFNADCQLGVEGCTCAIPEDDIKIGGTE